MRWRDPSGAATCNSKVITKSITLSGNPSSNNIEIWTEGSNSANTICSNTLSLIDAFYVDNSIDIWEWNLPSNWNTSIYGDGSNEVMLLEKQDENTADKKKNKKEYEIKFYENTSLKTNRSKVKVGDKINVTSLKKGTYVVHIIAPDGSVVKTRLIIDK